MLNDSEGILPISGCAPGLYVAVAQQPAQMLVYRLAGNVELARSFMDYVCGAGAYPLQEVAPHESTALLRARHIGQWLRRFHRLSTIAGVWCVCRCCGGRGGVRHSAAVLRHGQAVPEAAPRRPARAGRPRSCGPRAANLLKYKERYLLLIPALALFLVFRYVPMAGIVLAWKQFTVTGGLFGSPWAGWKFFERLFQSPDFFRVLRNTLFINGVLRMGIAFFMPIVFALLLNEVANLRFKRVVQTVSYLPHFLSWVVVASLIRPLAASTGPLNLLAAAAGLETPILFLQRPGTFLAIVLVSDIWKGVGWGSIIYLAAISGIDPALYESAQIDGAGRLQQMRFITLPSITFVIVIMFLLQLGNILELGFDQIFNLYHPLVYDVGDIIGTYVYRVGLQDFRYSFATAVGLFQNVIGLAALVGANWFIKRLGQAGAYTLT